MICALSLTMAMAARSDGSGPSACTRSVSSAKEDWKRSGPAALIGEFAGDLLPAIAQRADQRIFRQESILEHDFVEMMLRRTGPAPGGW